MCGRPWLSCLHSAMPPNPKHSDDPIGWKGATARTPDSQIKKRADSAGCGKLSHSEWTLDRAELLGGNLERMRPWCSLIVLLLRPKENLLFYLQKNMQPLIMAMVAI